MNTLDKIESVRRDIGKGLKSKAMNRLQGLINAYPNELEFREELGRLYLSVNWKEKAGLYLLLCKPKNKEEEEAISIYLNSINNSGHKALIDLKFKGNKEILPFECRERLETLENKSLKETNVIPLYKHTSPNKTEKTNTTKEMWRSRIEVFLVIILVASIPILVIIGIIQVVKWIW